MKINKKTTHEIIEFLSKYYSNQYASLVTGSYVEGTNNEFSDVDTIIFTKDRNNVFNEMVLYKDLKLQTIIIPVQNIQEILWIDYLTGQGTFVNMIAKGHIIFDQDDFLKSLISHTKELETHGVKPLSDYENYMARVKITSLLFDVMGAEDIDEHLYTIINLIDLVTQFKLKANGSWCSDGKYRMKLIKALDAEFYQKLTAAVADIYGNKNKENIINLTKELLEQHGGILPYYSKAHTLSKVSEDYLVVELDNSSNMEMLKNTIRVLREFIENIKQYKEIDCYFFSSKPVSKNKTEENIYLVINTKKEFINDFLIEHLNFFITGKENILRLQFPFQYDPVYRFSTKKTYNKLAPLFYRISKLITEKKGAMFNASHQIPFAVHLLKEAKNTWFADCPDMFSPFLKYLFECWFVFTYDDGLSFKTEVLLEKKKINLEKFEALFHGQQLQLRSSYNSESLIPKEVAAILKKISKFPEIKNIPVYKAYITPSGLSEMQRKQWSLFREIIFKTFSILFIDNRLISYIPFVVNKLELND